MVFDGQMIYDDVRALCGDPIGEKQVEASGESLGDDNLSRFLILRQSAVEEKRQFRATDLTATSREFT